MNRPLPSIVTSSHRNEQHFSDARPGRMLTMLSLMLVLVAGLPGPGLSPQPASAQQATPQPATAEASSPRLNYDGILDLPHLPSGAAAQGTLPTLLAPEYASWSRLVFQSARNERDWEVYGARGDGSDQVNLSKHGSMDTYPRLNRGGTRVVFASNRYGKYEILAMNADGSGQTRLTKDGTDDVYPAWSPDSSRIVFQAYRDGQAEIYVMNGDGSSQARLTNHGDYDGQPAWSPDGSRIAFVRRIDGQNRIWVMNADGSDARQLSNQSISEGPTWSPDGSQIAYDADGNGDNWQEIWLMDAAGGNQRVVYQPGESNTDAWVRSWSPDGRYVAFTRISWTYYQGQWYWTTAYLDAWDTQNTSNVVRLSTNGNDWRPDWQTTDISTPTSDVLPLPAQSPATFTVKWSGTDIGPAGLASFDVQVRDGAAGVWTDWKSSTADGSASYQGLGEHIYYFRARARDFAGNLEPWPADYDAVTTVESLPPVTAVRPLPAFTRGQSILVQWGGFDLGGSGIHSYDVQVRQNNDPWTDWQTGSTDTSASFSGTVGVKYGFRVRGKDNAQNLEAWPAVGAGASTTLYTWAITGEVTDNRGAPVEGMTVTSEPTAYQATPSDSAGVYSAYLVAPADNYTVNWSKAAYDTLPGTIFPSIQDASVDVVMPPADNVVQNWGIEGGSGAWQFSGSLTASVTSTVQHSGLCAAFLGSAAGPLSFITTLPDPPEQGRYPLADSALDAGGVIHSIWVGPGLHIMYSSKPPAGPWTIPEPLPGPLTCWGPLPGLHVDSAGTVHVVWWGCVDSFRLYYSQKRAGAEWSMPEDIAGLAGYLVSRPRLATTASGMLKVVWGDGPYFSQREPNGNWTSPQDISSPYGCHGETKMAIDPAGLVHVLWIGNDGSTGHLNAFYTAETGAGSWLATANLSQTEVDLNNVDMVSDAQGTVHVVWGADGVSYRMRPSGGTWSPKEQVASAVRAMASIAVDDLGGVHLAWGNWISWDLGNVLYAKRTGNAWSAPVDIAPPTISSLIQWEWETPHIAIDNYHTIHVLWLDSHLHDGNAFYGVRYSTRDAYGRWSLPADVYHHPGGEPFRDSQLLLDRSGAPHVLWAAPVAGNTWPVWYAGAEPVQIAGEATLSQAVVVPDAALAPTLSFLHRFGTEFPSDSRLEVVVDNSISSSVVFSTTTGTDAWTHRWVDLTPWSGRTVTLRFRVIAETGGSHTWAYIDEVTVGSAHPDTWVSLSGARATPPGGQFVRDLVYGNRGGVTAVNARVTLQLPHELAFISAEPPPTVSSPELRWDVGDLAAGSGPQSIRVTLQMALSAANGTSVLAAAAIASDTAEIEQVNNKAQAPTFVGHLNYLPIVVRR